MAMRPLARALFIGVMGLCLLGTARSASAFCRSRTCGDRCTNDQNECPIEGEPLIWPGSCLSYTVQRDGSTSISHAELSEAADAAFRAWQNATCFSIAAPPSIAVSNLFGVTSCDRVEFNSRQANANIIVIRDEWEGSPNALGLTTVSINRDTGAIYDVDMEINGTQPLSVGPVVPDRYDLESIITHEAGHFLGLAHSNVECPNGATMCPSYQAGVDTFRTLHDDDVAAICAVYPPDRNPPPCDPKPHRGFSPECGMDPMTGGACSVAISGRSSSRWMTALVLGFSLGVRRLCRARRRTQKLT